MVFEPEQSPKEPMDTIANHGTQTSGNAFSLPVPSMKPTQKLRAITSVAEEISRFDTDRFSVDPEILAKIASIDKERLAKSVAEVFAKISEFSKTRDVLVKDLVQVLFPAVGMLSRAPANYIRASIDQETDKLEVLSDSIGPALLSVLNVHGPMSKITMLDSLDITRDASNSHLETLQSTGLVVLEDEEYSISTEGLAFLKSLGLEEERT